MDIKEQILVALGLDKGEEVVMAYQAKSEDGTIFVSTADELAVGVDISVLTEDGTTILLPIGTYKTDTGVTFRVDEEGIVAEVMETETEEEVEAGYDDEKEEMAEAVEFAFPETDAEKADWAKSYEEMKDKVDNLIDAVADLKRDKDGGDDEVEEMSEEVVEPSTNPKSIKTTEVVEFSAEDELTKLKAENEKLKTELAESPASAPLDTNKFSSEATKVSLSKREISKMTKREQYLYNLYNN
jgi:regulator of replication initiation timing